jgi:uncharacterized protein (DUF2345 family)
MTKSVNNESKDLRTKDGNLRFGHIHKDQSKSSIMMQGQGGLEYITIDQEGSTKRCITSRCRGRFQVKAGKEIPQGQPAIYLDAESGDIVIRAKNRIRIEAENIDMIASGGDTQNGVINIKANEAINITSEKKVNIQGNESCNVFSNGNLQLSAENVCKMYGGSFEKLTGVGANLLSTTDFSSSLKLPFPIK